MLVFNRTTQLVDSQPNGFTLIELLVVMAIMATMMSLVGPLAINSIDKAQAKEEEMSLTRWVDNLSYRAFLSQQQIIMSLKGKTVIAKTSDETFSKTVNYQHLYFQPQEVVFNRNGFVQQSQIAYQKKDQTFYIPLDKSLVKNEN